MTTKRILIDLKTDEKASWIITDNTGTIQQTAAWQDLSELKSYATNAEITVIAPGEEVLLTQISLPKLTRQRLLQALPFALEEKLIEEVQNLHFAIGEYQSDTNTWPVAVIAKQKMDRWLLSLKKADISPTKMIPATLAIPFSPMHICHLEKISIVRTGQYSGFVAEHENLATILQLHSAETQQPMDVVNVYCFTHDTTQLPESMNNKTLHNTAQLPESMNNKTIRNIPQLPKTMIINDIPTDEKTFLEKTLEWLQKQPTINLLQGPYQPRQKNTFAKKIWMGTAGLAATCIALLFLNNAVSFFILQKASNKTEQAINTLYKQHFPQATSIVAPRERMESKLKKATSESHGNQALNLIALIGKSISHVPNVRLQNLDFRDHLLNLTVISTSFNSLDEFTQSLKKDGLQVKQQSAGMAGSEVKAILRINDKGVS